MKIDEIILSNRSGPYSISEISKNHLGDINIAIRIIDTAKMGDFLNYDMKSNIRFGFNYLMTDLNFAIGYIKLDRFEKWFIQKRKKIFNFYEKNCINLLKSTCKNKKQIPYRATVSFKNKRKRDQ